MLAISSGVAIRPMMEDGLYALTNANATCSIDWPVFSAVLFSISSTPSEKVGPRQHRIHRDPGSGGTLGESSRDCQDRCLGEAVMDHFGWNVQCRFRRQEDDASPVALEHRGHVGARQADTRHHIELEKPGPFAVGNVEEVLRAIDADIVDENVATRLRLHKRIATAGGRKVSRDPTNLGLWC